MVRRGLVRVAAWTAATGGAVALTWFGVGGALGGGGLGDAPRALSVPDAGAESGAGPAPSPTPTASPADRTPSPAPPSPGAPAGRGRGGRGPSTAPRSAAPPAAHPGTGAPTPTGPRHAPAPPSAPASAPSRSPDDGTPRTVVADGGRVALLTHRDRAELISATPRSGWSVRVWKNTGWIRVEFRRETRTSTIFCTWNGHPPAVQSYEQS